MKTHVIYIYIFIIILLYAGYSSAESISENSPVEAEISFADTFYYGNLYKLTVTLKNNSDQDYYHLLVRVQVPAGLTYENIMNGCIIKWETDELPHGEQITHEFFLTPVVNESKVYFLRSGVFSESSEILFIQDTELNVSKSALILEPVSVKDISPENSLVNFQLNVTNTADDTCRNILTEIYLSGELKFKDAVPEKYNHIPVFDDTWEKISFPGVNELNAGKTAYFNIKCITAKRGKGEFVFRITSDYGSHLFMKSIDIRN